MSSRSPLRNDVAISVIIGTLLLILITVTAASALALMVSQMQKQEMNRQSHLAQVKDEQLKVIYVNLSPNQSAPGYWGSAKITVLNLNIDDSRITSISINDIYAGKITTFPDSVVYNVSAGERIPVPATQAAELYVNFTTDLLHTVSIPQNQSIRVRLLSSYYNVFERTFTPPTATARMKIETEDLGVTKRDVVVLDGSDSFSQGSILVYNWSVIDGSGTWPKGNWNDMPNLTGKTTTYNGKISRTSLSSPGPFQVVLTVTDDSGLVGSSRPIIIPSNPKFTPASYLNVVYDGSSVITAKVTDIAGNPVSSNVVTFIKSYDRFGNLSISNLSGTTDSSGSVYTQRINGTGTIKTMSSGLPEVEISV
jgi:cell division protein FtsL